jgi:hypothetical protein
MNANTSSGGLGVGHWIAAGGALALIVSLFLPWYQLELPTQVGVVLGNAWAVFNGTDIGLLACAVAVLVLVVLATGIGSPAVDVQPGVVAALIAPVGLAATMLVIWKLVDQPDPQDLLSLQDGAFLALGGAGAMAVGGWMANAGRLMR